MRLTTFCPLKLLNLLFLYNAHASLLNPTHLLVSACLLSGSQVCSCNCCQGLTFNIYASAVTCECNFRDAAASSSTAHFPIALHTCTHLGTFRFLNIQAYCKAEPCVAKVFVCLNSVRILFHYFCRIIPFLVKLPYFAKQHSHSFYT